MTTLVDWDAGTLTPARALLWLALSAALFGVLLPPRVTAEAAAYADPITLTSLRAAPTALVLLLALPLLRYRLPRDALPHDALRHTVGGGRPTDNTPKPGQPVTHRMDGDVMDRHAQPRRREQNSLHDCFVFELVGIGRDREVAVRQLFADGAHDLVLDLGDPFERQRARHPDQHLAEQVPAGWAHAQRTESLLWTDDPPTV